MKIFTQVSEVREFSRESRRNGKKIGFVPTMGYLHEGHLSLVQIAKFAFLFLVATYTGQFRERCKVVIASIYTNPTQFAAHEDFSVYPVSKEEDRAKLEALGCDAVFEPRSLYSPDGSSDTDFVVGGDQSGSQSYQTFVRVETLETPLCGQSRPHFFRGVATIVAKLFNIVEPDISVFGMKDYQQLQVIKTMARELNFDIEIVPGPIVREADGLAMSSRNALIHQDVRPNCTVLYESLRWAKETLETKGFHGVSPNDLICAIKEKITNKGGKVDYIQVVNPETLRDLSEFTEGKVLIALAVFFPSKHPNSTVRLIDNIEIIPNS